MDEFAVAMYLIYAKLGGKDLPSVLPPELVPPSTRDLNALASFVKQEVITNLSVPKRQVQRNISASSFGESTYSMEPAKVEESAEDREALLVVIERKRRELSDLKSASGDQARTLKNAEEEIGRTKREIMSVQRDVLANVRSRDQFKMSIESAQSGLSSKSQSPLTSQASILDQQTLDVLREVRALETRLGDRKIEIAKSKAPVPQSSSSNLSSLLSANSGNSSDPVASKAAAMLAARMAALGMGGSLAPASASPAQAEITKAQEEKQARLKKLDDAESRIQSLLREIHSLSGIVPTATTLVSIWNPSVDEQIKYEDGVGLKSQEAQRVVSDVKALVREAKSQSVQPLPTKELT